MTHEQQEYLNEMFLGKEGAIKITFGTIQEKQDRKRTERLEQLRREAPFKAWVLPVLSRLELDFDGYRYTGSNSVRIITMLDGEPRWIDITWEKD